MKTLFFLKGLPASGKSTWAKERLKMGNTKRVNKDDLRAMLDDSKFTKGNERFIIAARDTLVNTALTLGNNVIVDDTNFHPEHEVTMRAIANAHRAKFEIVEFNTPLEECIRRDALREKPVGEKVIIDMYKTYVDVRPLENVAIDKIWVISDTHWDHEMLTREGLRPLDYGQQIIDNWKALVQPDDYVIHLGDVIFGRQKETLQDILASLPGKKLLIKGNHDYKPNSWYLEQGFEHVLDMMYYQSIMFTHIPTALPEGIYRNIHGHLHNNQGRVDESSNTLTERHKLVALEITGYKPLKLKELM